MKPVNHTISPRKPSLFNKLYLAFFIILPFVYSDQIVDPVLIPRQLFLTFFVLITGLLIAYQISTKKLESDFSFLKSGVPICFAVLIICVLFSFFQSIVISESLYVLSKYSIEFLFYIITTYLIIQKQLQLNSLIKSIVVFGTIVITIALYQFLNIDSPDENFEEKMYTITSTIAHKNLLASILFLSFPFLLNAVSLSKIWKIGAIVLGLTSFLLIWIIQTRSVIIASFVFIGLFIFFQLKNKSNSSYLRPKTLLIVGLLSVVLVSLVTFQNKEKFARVFNKDSARERISMWENTLTMIQERPFVGVGAGNWQIHFPEHGLDKFPNYLIKKGQITFQRPHNDFLWIFSELGIAGVITYCLLFGFIFYYLIKLLKKRKEEYWLYSSVFASIVGYILIALLDFPLERIEHQVFLLLIFALVTAHYHSTFKSDQAIESKTFRLKGSPFLFGAVIFFSLSASLQRNKGELATHRLYEAHHNANWIQMIEETNACTNSFYQIDATSIPIAWYRGVAFFTLENLEEAQLQFETAYQQNPYNVHVLNNLASCYESKGEHEKAISMYKKALRISSDFEETLLNLSAAYFNSGKFENAFLTIQLCDTNSIDPKYKVFLPAILSKKVDHSIRGINDPKLQEQINDLKNSNEALIRLYFESRSKGIEFSNYLKSDFYIKSFPSKN